MRRTSRPSSDIIRVSPKNAAGLSDYRKAQIEVDIEGGKLAEAPSYENSILKKNAMPNPAPSTGITAKKGWGYVEGQVSSGQTRNGNVMPTSGIGVVAHTTSYKTNEAEKFQRDTLLKSATGIGTLTGGTSSTAGSQFERFAPEIYSPLFTMANLNLPRDRITINAWIRNYFLLHPVVRNVITLHSTYPISKINIRCADKKAETFFSDMMEEMDLLTTLGELSLEWWKMGEVFPYGEFDENTGKWSRFVIQNPDYINVRKSIFGGEPIISLRPDEAMRRLVMSDAPADVQIRKSLPDNMVYQIRAGHDISLDNFNITQLKMGSSPYDVRGTSIIVSIFKDLALWDKIRECKFAQADGLINPITIIKVGGSTDGDYRATHEDLESFRQIFEEAQYDKNASIITHAGVTVERIGASGQVLETSEDMNLIIKNIYTGLMIPPAVIDQEGSTYASASIGLEVLRQRYFNFRNLISKWLINKVFAPISEVQGFYEYVDGTKKLIVPEIEWNQMNLYDLDTYIGQITGLVGSKQASLKTLYHSLGLNYEDEKVNMRKEAIDLAIRQREEQAMATMTLDELRTLDPQKEIREQTNIEERGQMGAGAAPGGAPGGMPDMGGLGGPPGGGMGGMPDLAPPPALEGGGGAGAPPVPGGAPPLGPGTGPPGPGM